MKKIFAFLAFFAFIGVAVTPSSASVNDNIDKVVQISIDDNNTVIADQDQDKDKDKKKKNTKKVTKVTKATAKSGSCCGSVKSGCGESSEGCGSSCGETKKEGSKERKKKTL